MRRASAFFVPLGLIPAAVLADEIDIARVKTEIGVEARAFPEKSRQGDAKQAGISLRLDHEIYYEHTPKRLSITINPYARFDSNDSERSNFDARQFFVRQSLGKFEYSIGAKKVFWGAAESVHLVDIINQSDFAENIDGEDKLGQPMVQLAYRTPVGTLEAFYMPMFRERRFPGEGQRLRVPAALNDDDALIDGGDSHRTDDFAARLSGSTGGMDFGLSYFDGIDRMPRFAPIAGTEEGPALQPFYERVKQTSLDGTFATGKWLWKLEALQQDGPTESFWAAIGGFEYTINGAFSTAADLGLLAEYMRDERQDSFYAPYQDDLFLGARLGLNDVGSTEVLVGVIVDQSGETVLGSAEASQRISTNIKISAELRMFDARDRRDAAAEIDHDSYAGVQVAWFF